MTDTEKITINMSVVDLGRVDLLVDEGFYSSRSDLIRTAIRRQLAEHADQVRNIVVDRSIGMGVMVIGKQFLEDALARGGKVEVKTIGLLIIQDDVTPELALKAIGPFKVYGAVRASPAVKTALGLK